MEDAFKDDPTGFITLSLGAKGSGKTHTLLAFLQEWLAAGKYAAYHLVLPNFEQEQDAAYAWLKQHKDRVYIYNRYADLVGDRVIAAQEGKKRAGTVFFAIDDATSQTDIFGSEPLMRIATESRHLGIHLWILAHAAKRVFSPVWRANIDNLFLGRITNTAVLKTIWEEWFSLVPGFDTYRGFMGKFGETVLAKEHGCIYLRVRGGEWEETQGWRMLKNGGSTPALRGRQSRESETKGATTPSSSPAEDPGENPKSARKGAHKPTGYHAAFAW